MVMVREGGTGGEGSGFMTDFGNQLYRRGPEKEQRGSARVLILEEAHEYVPLSPGKGEEVMLGAMKRLYTVGRNYWIGSIRATRRPGKLHTDLRNGADIPAFFQIVGTQDRKALQDYLGENAPEDIRKEIPSHLAKLPVGTAYFYQPDQDPSLLHLKFRYRNTLDTTTTEITAGHKVIKPVLAEVDLSALGDAMAAAREKAKADDPRELRKTIRELEAAVSRLKNEAAEPQVEVRAVEKVIRVEVPVYPDKVREWLRETSASVANSAQVLVELSKMLGAGADMKVTAGDRLVREVSAEDLVASSKTPALLQGRVAQPPVSHAGGPGERLPQRASVPPARPVPPARRSDKGHQDMNGSISGPQQRILDSLAWYESVGITTANRNQLALLPNYTPNTGTFNNYLGALRTAELIDYPSPGYVGLTDAGRAAASPVDITPTSEAMHQVLYAKLGGPRARILAALIAAYPNALSRE